MASPLLYKPEAAAEAVSMSRTKIYEAIRSGELESIKIGRCRRIPAAALEAFIERARAAQPAA